MTEIEFATRLLRDGETFGVRYSCACGCHPQVKLKRGAEAAHEHCCCGIAHAAGPNAHEHMERYLADRRTSGEDAERTYTLRDATVSDPWGGDVQVTYAVPETAA